MGGQKWLWYVRACVVREYESQALARAKNKPASVEEVNVRQRKKR